MRLPWLAPEVGFIRVRGDARTFFLHSYLTSSNDHQDGAPPLVPGPEWTGARVYLGDAPFELSGARAVVTLASIYNPTASPLHRDDEDDEGEEEDSEERGGRAVAPTPGGIRWWVDSQTSHSIMHYQL